MTFNVFDMLLLRDEMQKFDFILLAKKKNAAQYPLALLGMPCPASWDTSKWDLLAPLGRSSDFTEICLSTPEAGCGSCGSSMVLTISPFLHQSQMAASEVVMEILAWVGHGLASVH